MRTIITATTAYFFANAVVALKPNTTYYGKGKGNILDNELVFAKVSTTPFTYKTKETGLELNLFQKINSSEGTAALIYSHLKDEKGGLNMRFARIEEINKLKSLIEENNIELAYSDKDNALKVLDNYVTTAVPTSSFLDSLDGGDEILGTQMQKTKIIANADDAYEFHGSIVAFTPKTGYYGKRDGDIFGNGVVFAKMSSVITQYVTHEYGLGMELFQKIDSSVGATAITTQTLQGEGEDYLEMRLASLEEVKVLKNLVEDNQIQLAYRTQQDAFNFLDNYINTEDSNPKILHQAIIDSSVPGVSIITVEPYNKDTKMLGVGEDQTDTYTL